MTIKEIRTMDEPTLTKPVKIRWHESNSEEEALAERTFKEYLGKGWLAFAVTPTSKVQVFTFDPSLDKIVLTPPIGGG